MNGIILALLAMVAGPLPGAPAADDLVREALTRFPHQTVHFEVCELAKMRALPSYAVFRQKFMTGDAQQLADALARIGLRDEDVDRLALGAGPGPQGLQLYGVAQGRFDPAKILAGARTAAIEPITINGFTAYCFGDSNNSSCIAILNQSRGVFGSRDMVDFMLYAAESTDSLARDATVSARAARPPADATIWGIATGPAVAEWARVVMPVPAEGQEALAPFLGNVVSISYEVRATQKVALAADLACTTTESAARLLQSLQAARGLQQLAWRTLNPNTPNPYGQIGFRAQGPHLLLDAAMDYAALGSSQ